MRTFLCGTAFAILLTMAVCLTWAATAAAAWQLDGNLVCNAPGRQHSAAGVTDGAGGMIVAWVDERPTNPGIYAQRIDAEGNPQAGWPANGVWCSGTSSVGAPMVVPDGAGGALILWVSGPVRAQRIDAGGALHTGWPADGRVITSDLYSNNNVAAVPDGSGGAYFSRTKYNPIVGKSSIQLSRIDAEGAFVAPWTEAGANLANSESVMLHGLEPDPAGGVVAAMWYYADAGVDYSLGQVRRFAPNGTQTLIAGTTNPLADQFHPPLTGDVAAAPDGSGGAYVTFVDASNGIGRYGLHVNAAAQQLWAQPAAVPFSERVLQDGAEGAWLAGRPPGTQRLEVHRRLANGTLPPGWTGAGFVASQPASLSGMRATTVGDDLLLCWSENTSGAGYDIRAQRVKRDGTTPAGWPAGGAALCVAAGDQVGPVLVTGGGGLLACWEDRRGGAASDLYAFRLEPSVLDVDGPGKTTAFSLLSARPNPAREHLVVEFNLSGEVEASVQLIDLTGRSVIRQSVGGAGRHAERLSLGRLQPGVYWVRVTEGTRSAVSRIAVIR